MPLVQCPECDGKGDREQQVAIGGIMHDAPCVCMACDGTGWNDEPDPLPLVVSPEQCGASQLACDIVNNTFLGLDGFEPLRQRMDERERNATLTFASELARVTDRHVKTGRTALELAVIATGRIDAMNERETMRAARESVKVIASLFGLDAETLWKAAFDEWYRIGREASARAT